MRCRSAPPHDVCFLAVPVPHAPTGASTFMHPAWSGCDRGSDRARFRSPQWPPLDGPDQQFDLIYAFSVFTHLLDSWSASLIELHRLLKDDGVLAVTVFGPGHEAFGEEPIGDDVTGMDVLIRPTRGTSGARSSCMPSGGCARTGAAPSRSWTSSRAIQPARPRCSDRARSSCASVPAAIPSRTSSAPSPEKFARSRRSGRTSLAPPRGRRKAGALRNEPQLANAHPAAPGGRRRTKAARPQARLSCEP